MQRWPRKHVVAPSLAQLTPCEISTQVSTVVICMFIEEKLLKGKTPSNIATFDFLVYFLSFS